MNLCFDDQKHYPFKLVAKTTPNDSLAIFKETKCWLDAYFKGLKKKIHPPLRLIGTNFQEKVWRALLEIPYGTVITYQMVAIRIRNPKAFRAVGQAISRNPISIIIPCHRVIGSKQNLTGFAAGIERKVALLRREGLDLNRFSI
jgi:methylated-DNA-[protein]-cysteine S-methyltransferase